MNFLFRTPLSVLALIGALAHLPGALAQARPIFVLNSLDASVSVVDPVSWKEVKRIPTGKEPHHFYLTPDESSLIIANALSDSLTFIDPRTAEVQRTVRGILDPYQLRFSPDMKWFVTVANRLNHVDIYRWDNNTPTLVKRIATGKTPSHLWIDSKSTKVYATMQDSNELIAIDLAKQTLLWRIKTGKMPADIFGSVDDKTLYVGLTGSDGVEVFDVSAAQPKRTKLSRNRTSKTFEFRVADCKGFVTVGEYEDGQPGEIFVRVSKQGSTMAGINNNSSYFFRCLSKNMW